MMGAGKELTERPAQASLQSACDADKLALELAGGADERYGVSEVQKRETLLVRGRENQQKHFHSQIWTKEPHGGPYRKAS